jgi:hypothetical protein
MSFLRVARQEDSRSCGRTGSIPLSVRRRSRKLSAMPTMRIQHSTRSRQDPQRCVRSITTDPTLSCPPTDDALSAQAVEVYEKLVRDVPDDPPDLVIGGKVEAICTILLVC